MADSLEVYEGNINLEEVQRAVDSLKNNKAPGVDEISAEMLKHGKETVAEQLAKLLATNMQKQMANSCCPLSCQGPEDLSAKCILGSASVGSENHSDNKIIENLLLS